MEREECADPSFIDAQPSIPGVDKRRGPAFAPILARVQQSSAALALQTLYANAGRAAEVGDRLVDHLDLTDRALESLQVDRRCEFASPYEVLCRQPVRLAAAVDDNQAAQLDVGAVHVQA